MKKNKLFTVLAAITLFTSTSVIVENNNFNTTNYIKNREFMLESSIFYIFS